MSSNKDRLYVALHARSGGRNTTRPKGEDKYHWALIIGPKKEKDDSTGIQIHAKNVVRPGGIQEWVREQADVALAATGTCLVRIQIAKIVGTAQLLELMNSVPVQPDQLGWNCISWVQDALEGLRQSNGILGRSVLEWEKIRDGTLSYVTRKCEQARFSQSGDWDKSRVATYDLLDDREITP